MTDCNVNLSTDLIKDAIEDSADITDSEQHAERRHTELLEYNQKILNQLRIMNVYLSMMVGDTIKEEDLEDDDN